MELTSGKCIVTIDAFKKRYDLLLTKLSSPCRVDQDPADSPDLPERWDSRESQARRDRPDRAARQAREVSAVKWARLDNPDPQDPQDRPASAENGANRSVNVALAEVTVSDISTQKKGLVLVTENALVMENAGTNQLWQGIEERKAVDDEQGCLESGVRQSLSEAVLWAKLLSITFCIVCL